MPTPCAISRLCPVRRSYRPGRRSYRRPRKSRSAGIPNLSRPAFKIVLWVPCTIPCGPMNIQPPAGHLSVICDPKRNNALPVIIIVEHAYHQGVRDDYPRRVGGRRKQADRMSGFKHQGLLLRRDFQVAFNQAILHQF